MNTKKILGFALVHGFPLLLQAQQQEQATGLRASGKIYVVVGVILIILFGLIGYLISLDRKINRMEQHLRKSKPSGKS
ncbi:MAG: CcmD family protein [Bacteroidetes bacterium]|nr:CcmD family protein [Bacteroidota bacterium]